MYIYGQFGIDVDRPPPCQVSRFDPWKDPLGVIDAYRIVKAGWPDVPAVRRQFLMPRACCAAGLSCSSSSRSDR